MSRLLLKVKKIGEITTKYNIHNFCLISMENSRTQYNFCKNFSSIYINNVAVISLVSRCLLPASTVTIIDVFSEEHKPLCFLWFEKNGCPVYLPGNEVSFLLQFSLSKLKKQSDITASRVSE